MKHLTLTELEYLQNNINSLSIEVNKAIESIKDVKHEYNLVFIDPSYMREKLDKINNIIK